LANVEELIREFLRWAADLPDLLFFLTLFSGALLEYVFPPFPGDMVTAFGAILITQGKKFLTVFLGVNLGSAGGFLLDYLFGLWLSNPNRRFRQWGPRWEKMGRGIDRIARGFDRHPELYLVVNRFLPGIRALFFVAAGFARVKVWKVLLYGMLSAVVWSLLLIAAGYLVGKNLDRLLLWLNRYTWAAWIILITVVGVALMRYFRKRRREGSQSRAN